MEASGSLEEDDQEDDKEENVKKGGRRGRGWRKKLRRRRKNMKLITFQLKGRRARKSEEKVVGFCSATLFPGRKLEAVIQGGIMGPGV